jgi:hypothetical protein
MTEGQILVDLILRGEFDKINSLKWKIKCLQFDVYTGRSFNSKLDGLIFPDSLEHIYFSDAFNQSLDNVKFSKNLKVILFGPKFNQRIDKMNISESLELLQFGDDFDQSIDNIIFPNSLKNICFGENFNHSLTNAKFSNNISIYLHSIESTELLPLNIEHLSVKYLTKPLLNFPITLKTFTFYCDLENNFEQTKIPFGCKVYKINNLNQKEQIII